MLTLDEAFAKFKSRLELSTDEQDDASRRQKEIREIVADSLDVRRSILTGSYARWTKTKPLKDVDIFEILGDGERTWRNGSPSELLERVAGVLRPKYGGDCVAIARRSVRVDFGVTLADDDTGGKVMSFDVVPAFEKNEHYEIPDCITGGWIATDREVHAEMATKANDTYDGQWKPLVKMIKKWNVTADKPVKPSFLLEVMALDLLVPPFSGGYPYELKAFFAAAADRIGEPWPDPARLGPPVSDSMTPSEVVAAKQALQVAELTVTRAIQTGKQGKNGEALQTWRGLFGSLFPLS